MMVDERLLFEQWKCTRLKSLWPMRSPEAAQGSRIGGRKIKCAVGRDSVSLVYTKCLVLQSSWRRKATGGSRLQMERRSMDVDGGRVKFLLVS